MNPKDYIQVSEAALNMISKVNIESNVAVYTQIENSIRFAIASGAIKSGEKLPSVRDMTELTQVNPNTIAKVYRDLEVMGLVYARRGMGVFIREGALERCRERVRTEIISRMYEVCAESKAAGIPDTEAKSLLNKCLANAPDSPYSPAPDSLLALAK